MNLKTVLTAALLVGSASIMAGCASGGHQRSSGEVFDDATITTKVKSALLKEDDVKSFDIKVETFNGTVQLSGFVDSQWQIDKAVQVASAVKGVQSVKNDLIHKPN
jgi:hyperosmotically inducible periplasmic protein